MDKIDTIFIGKNVKSLREAIALSQHDFSLLLEISKRSVANIESGEKNIDVELLRKVKSLFFMYSRDQLCNDKIEIPHNLKEQLIKHFKDVKPEVVILLNKMPSIVYAIKFKLLRSDFIDQYRETNEIKKFFERFGWEFEGTSITNALTRMPDLIESKRHISKGNTNVYKKRL